MIEINKYFSIFQSTIYANKDLNFFFFLIYYFLFLFLFKKKILFKKFLLNFLKILKIINYLVIIAIAFVAGMYYYKNNSNKF